MGFGTSPFFVAPFFLLFLFSLLSIFSILALLTLFILLRFLALHQTHHGHKMNRGGNNSITHLMKPIHPVRNRRSRRRTTAHHGIQQNRHRRLEHGRRHLDHGRPNRLHRLDQPTEEALLLGPLGASQDHALGQALLIRLQHRLQRTLRHHRPVCQQRRRLLVAPRVRPVEQRLRRTTTRGLLLRQNLVQRLQARPRRGEEHRLGDGQTLRQERADVVKEGLRLRGPLGLRHGSLPRGAQEAVGVGVARAEIRLGSARGGLDGEGVFAVLPDGFLAQEVLRGGEAEAGLREEGDELGAELVGLGSGESRGGVLLLDGGEEFLRGRAALEAQDGLEGRLGEDGALGGARGEGDGLGDDLAGREVRLGEAGFLDGFAESAEGDAADGGDGGAQGPEERGDERERRLGDGGDDAANVFEDVEEALGGALETARLGGGVGFGWGQRGEGLAGDVFDVDIGRVERPDEDGVLDAVLATRNTGRVLVAAAVAVGADDATAVGLEAAVSLDDGGAGLT